MKKVLPLLVALVAWPFLSLHAQLAPAHRLLGASVNVRGTLAGISTTGRILPKQWNAPLTLQPVPEPQTWLVAFCGLATLLALQRFRRSRNVRTP